MERPAPDGAAEHDVHPQAVHPAGAGVVERLGGAERTAPAALEPAERAMLTALLRRATGPA